MVLAENNNGVEKSWFMTDSSAAGASYGLIGALVSVTMDAIINAGPSMRARRAANEIAELMPAEALNASLTEHLRRQVPEGEVTGVSVAGVETAQKILTPGVIDDAVEIGTSYTLSEDASTLRIVAYATYENASTPYVTPYTFEGRVPRTETVGPIYRNTFTYYSAQLPTPVLTPELRERLVASVQDSARDDSGALPVEGTNEYRAMTRELENARDNNLTKSEIAIFLTREWLRDDGALLRREVEQAHDFIARYVAQDMNRTAVPSIEGQDELLETSAEQRTVRRMGAGITAGSYISSPGSVAGYATYGNAISIARVHSDRVDALRDQRRAAAR